MKLDYPATGRNKDFIKDALKEYLPDNGTVLEIASGSGQHICHFAKEFSQLKWLPSDVDPEGRKSVDAWVDELGLKNVEKCLSLDARVTWDIVAIDFLLCINMIHISEWESTLGLFNNAQKLLSSGQFFFFYGPFIIEEIRTSESNLQFHQSLVQRNPEWGIRSLREVTDVARKTGFEFKEYITMPANNYCVIFQKI